MRMIKLTIMITIIMMAIITITLIIVSKDR